MEIWKEVKDYEGYKISNLGNVKSKTGRLLKPCKSANGYLVLGLGKGDKRKTKSIHQLLAIAFLGHTPNGMKLVVDHINGIKTDNRLINLQVITNRHNLSKDRGFRIRPSIIRCLS